MSSDFDSLLWVSFGGPEGPDDVIPFLENVLRGKNVPRERMLAVADHYLHLGGASPINDQNRQLIAALEAELARVGPRLPIYWGNRNWHPLLPDAIRQMRQDGRQRALAFVTSAYSSYSGCRQYLEDIERARAEVGVGAPIIEKLRPFYDHPGFIDATVDRVQTALTEVPSSVGPFPSTRLVFTAHSIPISMANGCQYVDQLQQVCQLVTERIGLGSWQLAYQSRSGPPQQPWLEPDIADVLRSLVQDGCRAVIVVPIGFISDHMEVRYDLDTEARALAAELGLYFVRAATVGTHPRFVTMIRELIVERTQGGPPLSLSMREPICHTCPNECCPSGRPA